MTKMETKFKITPMSKKEVAAMYNFSTKTLDTQLRPFLTTIGVKNGRYYNINQVKTIIEKLGIPPTYQD